MPPRVPGVLLLVLVVLLLLVLVLVLVLRVLLPVLGPGTAGTVPS